jgi:hypothetical protein
MYWRAEHGTNEGYMRGTEVSPGEAFRDRERKQYGVGKDGRLVRLDKDQRTKKERVAERRKSRRDQQKGRS